MKRIYLMLITAMMSAGAFAQNQLKSPDGNIKVDISLSDNQLTYSVKYKDSYALKNSAAKLDLNSQNNAVKLKVGKTVLHKDVVKGILYRQDEFSETYNETTIGLNASQSVTFRVFDDGVAYRFNYLGTKPAIVDNETAKFCFAEDYGSYLSYSTNEKDEFAMAFQNIYSHEKLSEQKSNLSFLPVVVDENSFKVTVLEADVEAYPGMFLKPEGQTLNAVFPQYPKTMAYYPWRGMSHVDQRENFIAKLSAKQSLPWRVISITTEDKQMPVSNLVYELASPNRLKGDLSWIKPGKVAWDWWNDWSIKGVDFQAGINTETYKYFIDFAAANHLAYIILDEGWYDSKKADIMNPIADIDLKELIKYGQEKGVDIILWAVFNVVDEHLNEVFEHYSKMGIKGFKIDFMDRNDQTAVEMAYRIAQKAADYHLVLDYHGFYEPTGFNRTYPNIINVESVFGMEEMKWNDDNKDMPLYDVTFPFVRMQCGIVDYTPGAMKNGSKYSYKPIYSCPMSMGTRAHQAACYIVHDSPLTMLADAPSNYTQEQVYTDFITSLPQEFSKTEILDGKIGEYIVTMRQNSVNYYVAGLTNWDGRDISVDFSFLPKGNYDVFLLRDGVNAYKNAEDYKIEQFKIDETDVKKIHLASGGGFVMKIMRSYATSSVPTQLPEGSKYDGNFYKKYLNVSGIPTISSAKVSDIALMKVQEIIDMMLIKRPDVKQQMIKSGCYTMVISDKEQVCDLPEYKHICDCDSAIKFWNWRARGFGGFPQDSLTASFGEENVLQYPTDKYYGESIVIHEFSHIIHTVGILGIEPKFDDKLKSCLQHAKENHLWDGTYAQTDIYEYFAEGVQSFLNCNHVPNKNHNCIMTNEQLKNYDFELYKLLSEYFDYVEIPWNN